MSGLRVEVVGGGLAGLVAAIECAEQGAEVVLREAHDSLGGRARSTDGPFCANFGPHALYKGRTNWRWLAERDLLPPTAKPAGRAIRYRHEGRMRRIPPLAALRAFAKLRRGAPLDRDFHGWASEQCGEKAAAILCAWAGPFSFYHDPGSLSAAFVAERLRWIYSPPSIRYVPGGWGEIVARRARALGVQIKTGSRVEDLPAPPVIVATELPQACDLLGDPGLRAESGNVLCLDLGLSSRRGDPLAVLDLDEGMLAERFPGSAPAGQVLIQACHGLSPDANPDEALSRLEALLDSAFPGWREREIWRRRQRAVGRTGAVDLPGRSWEDRPAIDRGEGVYVVGDMVAAPGLLSDVSFTSASKASRLALRWANC
jgi:glycine/D-amino acid oxidase-like deaminating enzyme